MSGEDEEMRERREMSDPNDDYTFPGEHPGRDLVELMPLNPTPAGTGGKELRESRSEAELRTPAQGLATAYVALLSAKQEAERERDQFKNWYTVVSATSEEWKDRYFKMQGRTEAAEAALAELRSVCAEAYQMAGALGAPVEALDNLSAASRGAKLPHGTFLPVEPCGERAGQARALVEAGARAGAILEALHASVVWELAPEVRREIAEVIPIVRVALSAAGWKGGAEHE